VVGVTTAVSEYEDIGGHEEMTTSDRDAMARCLQSGLRDDVLLAFVPRWLADEKDIATVVTQPIDHETDKAYLVTIDGRDVWLPKSVIERFVPTVNATISVPQRDLTDFAGGGEA
jgi:hypothetical protein